jgi:hypothetical protein
MDTAALITETKARFAHNSARAYLAEKYESKLIVADQGGLWRADQQTITMLTAFSNIKNIVLIDTFDNPVKVNREELLKKLKEVYLEVTYDWHQEWQELESKR